MNRRLEVTAMCCRRMLRIIWTENENNEEVLRKIKLEGTLLFRIRKRHRKETAGASRHCSKE